MKLRQFLLVVWSDWTARVTGALSIPSTLLAFYVNSAAQKAAWNVLAIAALLVTSYRVWRKEYDSRMKAELQLYNRRAFLVLGCDWTFGRSFTPTPDLASDRITAVLGRDRDYFSPYYLRNDGSETAYNVTITLPERFRHIRFIHRNDYPADGQPHAVHLRVDQRNVSYDLAEVLRDTPGVLAEIIHGASTHGMFELTIPISVSYSGTSDTTFTDTWVIILRSRQDRDGQVTHEPLAIRNQASESSPTTVDTHRLSGLS